MVSPLAPEDPHGTTPYRVRPVDALRVGAAAHPDMVWPHRPGAGAILRRMAKRSEPVPEIAYYGTGTVKLKGSLLDGEFHGVRG